MAVRVAVNPELLAWARERSGVEPEDLARKFPKLAEWEEGELAPTLKQLEQFAHATKTPVGYLFLQAPVGFENSVTLSQDALS
jgi:transcriptional regulator with XRE-family HTH domain